MLTFGHSEFIPVFLGQTVRKFWNGHSEFIPVFWENCQKKDGTANFGHSEFVAVFLGKIVRKI